MINDDAFKEGWNYILEHPALFVGQKYCKDSLVQEQDLINEINTFIDNLNKYNGNESNPEQLKGYIAEEFQDVFDERTLVVLFVVQVLDVA